MEQNRETRSRSIYVCSADFWQRCRSNSMKKIVFSVNSVGTIGQNKGKKKRHDVNFTFYTTINSKWIINLNVKWKTIKLLEENIEENIYDLGIDHEFWAMIPKARGKKINNLDFIKI